MLVSLLDLVLIPDTACVPFLMSVGYIRLVSASSSLSSVQRVDICIQRVIVLKDQSNKKAHEDSAQLACEAAASIRTVASLTREDDCLEIYSKSLEGPLRRSNRTAIWSNALFGISQAFSFFIISLVFWYGSILVSNLEFNTKQFFTGLMVMYYIAKVIYALIFSLTRIGNRLWCHAGRKRVRLRSRHLISTRRSFGHHSVT